MSLEITQQPRETAALPRYFLYLKAGKIIKSVFTKHPLLAGATFVLALIILNRAGVKLQDVYKFGGKIIQLHRRINAMVVEFKTALTSEQLAWLEEHLHVDIEPVKEVRAYMDKAVVQSGVSIVQATTSFTGNGIKVAVVDTGINDNHPDLAGKVIARYDFSDKDYFGKSLWPWDWFKSTPKIPVAPKLDGVGHGSHCAGVIAGSGKTYKGVAPKVALIDARVLNDSGHGSNDTVIKGMSWAADQGADIISMSLGGEGTPDDAISREADALASEGIVVVVAAGNEGPRAKTIGSPSCAAKVITVGSVDQENKVTQYSSRGPVIYNGLDLTKPDLVAPGGGTMSAYGRCYYENGITSVKSFDTKNNNCTVQADGTSYQRMSGTSMACPHVAGICALVLEAAPNWTKACPERCAAVKNLLKATVKKLPYSANECGVGLVDAKAAIDALKDKSNA